LGTAACASGQCDVNNVCVPVVCTPETAEEFRERAIAEGRECGEVEGPDANCGTQITIDLGTADCASGQCDVNNVCVPVVCTPETAEEFRIRVADEEGRVCGSINKPADANCGVGITVELGTTACTGDTPQCDGALNVCIGNNAAPSNNMCAGAAAMTLGATFYGNTTNATSNYGAALSDACGNLTSQGRELVYSYTPAADGNFRVLVTPAAGTNYNPLLWMTEGEGTCGDGNMCVAAANSGGNGGPEELSVAGVAGTTYYFYVDTANNGNGNPARGVFTIQILPQ
ncbi:MAG: hypothetical protein FWC18_04325, partial [Cystobacterineae bacterium]|nr:hypothetical protein [Cystobacterineae bacterium]